MSDKERQTQRLGRREALKTIGVTAACAMVGSQVPRLASANDKQLPGYLKDFSEQYADPRAAAREWFSQAKYGLFMHYGLYSQLARGEWVMLREKIPVSEYMKLKETFRPDRFDADKITDMALDAGMKYVNITSRHHDGFSLFATQQNDYHAAASPARRDLIAELSEQCHRRISVCSSTTRTRPTGGIPGSMTGRPAGVRLVRLTLSGPRSTEWRKDEDFRKYIDFVHAQLRELLTNYGPLAGIWFDPIMGFYARPDLFPVDDTYALVRSLQPQVLISFKQGDTGTEDFAAPERSGRSLVDRVQKLAPEVGPCGGQGLGIEPAQTQ